MAAHDPGKSHGASAWGLVAAASVLALLLLLAGAGRAQAEPEARVAPAAASNEAAGVVSPSAAGTRLPGYGPRVFGAWPSVNQMTELGRQIFFDRGLSRSGRMSCASCHDPAHAYGPPNGLNVQRGGAAMDRTGVRAVPTLRYLVTSIPFTEHFVDDEDGHGEDGGPTGALTWDGRVDSAHEQALIPLFAEHEFANRTPAELAARVRKAPYASAFEQAFSGPGERVFDAPERVLGWLAMALEIYQQSAADFYPYSSKYDAFLRGSAALSPAEQRGLALFNAPGKGNCASCHPSGVGSGGSLPLFTDSSYVALGVPRNRRIQAPAGAPRRDLGLCANGRVGLAEHDEYCGRFKTPTLRNVATRHVFFHNGALHSLEQVVRFYAERDTHPERWYPRDARGRLLKFDDIPARLHDNVVTTPPFGGRPGDAARLTPAEIRDIVDFLRTLTDGWSARGPDG